MKPIDKVLCILGGLSIVAAVFIVREVRILVVPRDDVSIYVQPEPVVDGKADCIENTHYIYCPPKQ